MWNTTLLKHHRNYSGWNNWRDNSNLIGPIQLSWWNLLPLIGIPWNASSFSPSNGQAQALLSFVKFIILKATATKLSKLSVTAVWILKTANKITSKDALDS